MATETVNESLKGISAYPIPLRTLCEVAERRGLVLTDEATQAVLESSAYKLATADLLLWLTLAPNISQGGQNYSFSDEQRKEFRRRATSIYNRTDPEEARNHTTYGYKGSKL